MPKTVDLIGTADKVRGMLMHLLFLATDAETRSAIRRTISEMDGVEKALQRLADLEETTSATELSEC